MGQAATHGPGDGGGESVRRATGSVLLALVLALSPPAAAKDRPVRDRIISIVRAKLPNAIVTPADRYVFTLKLPDTNEQQINVERIADYCSLNDPAECDAQIRTFAELVASFATETFAITRERLRVIVRGRPDTEGYVAMFADPAKRPLVRPLFADVSAVLAADFPKGTRMVSAEDLADLKLGADQAFDIGMDQTLADLPKVPALSEIDGKIIVISGFDYGASVMLRPDRWRALADASGGRLYVAIPADNEVIVGTTKSDDELPKLREMVSQEYALAARGVSSLVYRWSATGWVAAK